MSIRRVSALTSFLTVVSAFRRPMAGLKPSNAYGGAKQNTGLSTALLFSTTAILGAGTALCASFAEGPEEDKFQSTKYVCDL